MGLEIFLARKLTLNYYNKLATMHCNRFSTILHIISHNYLIILMKSGITTKYWFVKNITESFTLFVVRFLYVLFITQATLVFFQSVVNFPDNCRRYSGDFRLRYYDFSPFLLLKTLGFSELLLARPRLLSRLCPGDLTALPQTPSWQEQ